MTVKERTENFESQILSPYACQSKNSRGRMEKDKECDLRTDFQRDRDKIIHSKSFRRLKHKTQVFIAPEKDHYRTRLTHTLEVSQIARTIARALRLNEDLTEAISLAHDLGHTPFGHTGESALNDICPSGFKHYEQSLRVVDVIDKLNLTFEVRDGILCHTRGKEADTVEGRLVKLADKIAYMNHDIDDAIRANILKEKDLPSKITEVIGKSCTERIDTIVRSIVSNTIGENLRMSNEVEKAFYELHSFMYENVYWSDYSKEEKTKVPQFIECLYNYFKNNPELLPQEMRQTIDEYGIDRVVCDYIAGMTDHFATHVFEEIFIPKSWNI